MTDILIAVMVIATVVLGALTYVKLKRAMGSASEQENVGKNRSSRLPPELRELQIGGPHENMLDRPGEPKGNPRGQQNTSNRQAS